MGTTGGEVFSWIPSALPRRKQELDAKWPRRDDSQYVKPISGKNSIMHIRSEQLFSVVIPKSKLGKLVQFPLVRLLIAPLFFLPFSIPHNTFVAPILEKLQPPLYSYMVNLDAVVSFIVFLLLYRLYARLIERRKAWEISGEKVFGELGLGFLISFLLVGVTVGLMALLGYYRIMSFGSAQILVNAVFRFGMGSFVQDIVFLVIIFKLTEEFLGSWIAILLYAVVFGLLHMGNENATFWTIVGLVLGSLILPIAYMYSRRLWLAWGIHFGWNYLQDGIFGMPNSGITKLPSWITPTIEGPKWITGGAFGIEASYIAVFLCLAAGLFVLKKAIDRGQVVLPAWKRKQDRVGVT
jgi:membrane protease YdiL (CAAX protease family)